MDTALAGTPNCGKTTLFNRLTGLSQTTGNRAGVTVAPKTGSAVIAGRRVSVTDLPGIYSLDERGSEGRFAAEFLSRNAGAVICVIDLTAPERGLSLAMQLANSGHPTLIGANFSDLFKSSGGSGDFSGLSDALGIPVVPFSAYSGENVARLTQTPPAVKTGFPDDPAERYALVSALCSRYLRPGAGRALAREKMFSRKILPFVLFFSLIGAIFFLSFGTPGRALSSLTAAGLSRISALLRDWVELPALADRFIFGGVLPGAASLLAFLPQLFLLFFCISLLEESGLISRAAFIFDAPMRKLGLSGQAVVPLLLGLGCTVPAILSVRTVRDARERRRLILSLPFVSCGARLPVYSFFAASFFGSLAPAAILALYLMGFSFALGSAAFARRGETRELSPLELPELRAPKLRSVLTQSIAGVRHYAARAVGPLSLAFGIFSLLASTPLLERICSFAAPAFLPLGFGSWQAVAALAAGFLGKEAVVGTLSVLPGTAFGAAGAFSFTVFVLLYPPCISALSAVSRELGKKAAGLLTVKQLAAAYLTALFFYTVLKYL